MNDKANIQDNQGSISEHRLRGRGRRAFWVIVLIGVAVALASYLPGCTGHPRHQRGFVMEDGPQRIHKGTGWALTQVDATEEQRQEVATILQGLDPDVVRWQEERQALKARFIQALAAEQVNPNELATIKSAGVELADQALSRTVEVVLKVSDVLTPEQRQELVEKWRAHQ